MTWTMFRCERLQAYTWGAGEGMSWRRKFRLAMLAGWLVVGPAAAHDFWLMPDRFAVRPGGAVSMSLQVGHGKDRQKSLMTRDRVTRFDALSPAGRMDRRRDLRLGDANADTQLVFATRGVQVLAFETNGTYSELPDIRFNDYLKFEGMTPAIDWRAKTNTTDKPGREVYSRRAKALIQVGPYAPADDAVATRMVGMPLEIVPEVNPYAPGFSGKLPVRIYYMGKPLAGATVMINNLDFDTRPVATVVSDGSGRAVFTIPKVGEWQMNVVWTRPVSGNARADFETVFSSLAFGFAAG